MSSPEAWHNYSMHATEGDLPARRFWGVEVGLNPAREKNRHAMVDHESALRQQLLKLVLDAMVSCRHST